MRLASCLVALAALAGSAAAATAADKNHRATWGYAGAGKRVNYRLGTGPYAIPWVERACGMDETIFVGGGGGGGGGLQQLNGFYLLLLLLSILLLLLVVRGVGFVCSLITPSTKSHKKDRQNDWAKYGGKDECLFLEK